MIKISQQAYGLKKTEEEDDDDDVIKSLRSNYITATKCNFYFYKTTQHKHFFTTY